MNRGVVNLVLVWRGNINRSGAWIVPNDISGQTGGDGRQASEQQIGNRQPHEERGRGFPSGYGGVIVMLMKLHYH